MYFGYQINPFNIIFKRLFTAFKIESNLELLELFSMELTFTHGRIIRPRFIISIHNKNGGSVE